MTYIPPGGSSPPSGAAGGDLSGTYPNPGVAKVASTTPGAGGLSILDDADASAMRSTLGLGTAATTAASDYQAVSAKDAASGYAGLNSASRTTKGVLATDDIVIDLATKGVVFKDTNGTPHYWRLNLTGLLGVIQTVDLGTVAP